jgi:TRAP-type C4-dicarboxylate transport system substrate-binding protein
MQFRLYTIVCLVLLVLSCDSSTESDVIEMTVAGTAIPNTVGEAHFLNFKTAVDAQSQGTLKLKMLVHGQLGSEENLVSGLRRNRVHFANLSAIITSTLIPETALLYAPYLFDNEEEADFVYDNYLTQIFTELLAAKGLQFISWSEIGFHNVYGKEPILLPEHAKGKRYRVSASLSSRYFAEAIGADLIPMGYAEIVQSLQTGLIEAGDNSVALYAKRGIDQEAPHNTLTQHSLGMSIMVARKIWWDQLNPRQQQIITNAWPEAKILRQSLRAEVARDLANAASLGIVVHALSASDRELWKQATQGQTERLALAIGGQATEVLDLISEGKKQFQLMLN